MINRPKLLGTFIYQILIPGSAGRAHIGEMLPRDLPLGVPAGAGLGTRTSDQVLHQVQGASKALGDLDPQRRPSLPIPKPHS